MGKNIALPSTLIVSFDGPSASAFNLGGHKGTHPSPSRALAFSLSPSLSFPRSLTRSFSFRRRGSTYACAPVKHAFVRDPRHAAHAEREKYARIEKERGSWRGRERRGVRREDGKKKGAGEGRKESRARAERPERRELSRRSSSVADEWSRVRRKG